MAPRNDISQGQVAYVNARLLDPAAGLDTAGGILTDGEAITDVGPAVVKKKAPKGARIVDCHGKCLSPGLVDIRVELGDLAATVEAAVSGGVTSMVCLPTPELVIDDMSEVEFVARRARKLGLAKVYPYGAVTKGLEGKELAEMGLLAEAGAVAFTDGEKVIADAQVLRRALTYARTFDLLIIQHPEEPSLACGVMNAGEVATRLGLSGIPPVAESIMVERDIRLVELTGGKLHFAHVSTADAIDAIRKAKLKGLRITCDTAPPYFALNETSVGEYRTFAKLSPPLRGEKDRQAVVEGIRNGTIDVIASDHAPQDEDSKRLPFSQAAYGGVGLETLLSVTLELFHNGHMSLLDVLAKVTCAPADLLGLPAGRLQAGERADFTVFDPNRGWQVNADDLASKSKNTPFDGRLVQGVVLRTVIDGRTVYRVDN